ncbi:MAG: DUF533 domain-containing protein [Paracoccaceae bacterium]
MSLSRMATKLAFAFAAAKGVDYFRQNGGMEGLKRQLAGTPAAGTQGDRSGTDAMRAASQQSGGTQGGGLGGMLGRLGGGTSSGGGLGGLLNSLGGGTGGSATSGGAGLAGLLGGLASMAGGPGTAQARDPHAAMQAAETGVQDESLARAMIRAMVQAARSDGNIDGKERETLMEVMGEADDPEDEAALNEALAEPVNPEALARDVPRGRGAQVYAAALMAIDPDNFAEQAYLTRLKAALGLSDEDQRQAHEVQGKPLPQ